MYLAIALIGIGSVALAMFQWNKDEAHIDLIPAPVPTEGTDQTARLRDST